MYARCGRGLTPFAEELGNVPTLLDCIMDHLRVLLVPFHPTILMMVGLFSLFMGFFLWAASFLGVVGFWAVIVAFMLNTWVLKYGFVLIERIADGATEPPVMDSDMVSPFEQRPFMQTLLLLASVTLCWKVGGDRGVAVGIVLLLTLPAQVALLGMGDNIFRAMNPFAWFRVIRGMGPMYVFLLVALAVITGINVLVVKLSMWTFFAVAVFLLGEVVFFGFVGACIWLRRQQLGFEPSRSPERTAMFAEGARVKLRAHMMDEVFQSARMGKFVDATAPLANWMKALDPEHAARDALHVAEQTLKWQLPLALNPVGSTLIRHLLRYGRPDAALAVFEMFRERSARFTMDSAPDLRVLAEYAESVGKEELAQSMRLETPVVHPPT
jgi:pentatricopeptide repeat protein